MAQSGREEMGMKIQEDGRAGSSGGKEKNIYIRVGEKSQNGITEKLFCDPCGSCTKMFLLACTEPGTQGDPWREFRAAQL